MSHDRANGIRFGRVSDRASGQLGKKLRDLKEDRRGGLPLHELGADDTADTDLPDAPPRGWARPGSLR